MKKQMIFGNKTKCVDICLKSWYTKDVRKVRNALLRKGGIKWNWQK